MNCRCDALRCSSSEHSDFLRHLSFVLRHYGHSYLSAVTGSSRDAVHAGANPEINPVMTDTIMLITTNPVENWIGKDGKAMPMRKHMAKAKPSPIIPPSKQRAVDSIKNWRRLVRRRAPSALRVPISFVRSFTLTKVIFIIPIALKKSESPVMKSPATAMEFLIGSSVLFRVC